jgi:hypothetical protein
MARDCKSLCPKTFTRSYRKKANALQKSWLSLYCAYIFSARPAFCIAEGRKSGWLGQTNQTSRISECSFYSVHPPSNAHHLHSNRIIIERINSSDECCGLEMIPGAGIKSQWGHRPEELSPRRHAPIERRRENSCIHSTTLLVLPFDLPPGNAQRHKSRRMPVPSTPISIT